MNLSIPRYITEETKNKIINSSWLVLAHRLSTATVKRNLVSTTGALSYLPLVFQVSNIRIKN